MQYTPRTAWPFAGTPQASEAPPIFSPTVGQLTEALLFERVPPAKATRRAEALHRTLQTLKKLQFGLLPPAHLYGTPLSQYIFGPTDFELTTSPPIHASAVKPIATSITGTGLDRESVNHFAKVCELGETLIPHLWRRPGKLRKSLDTSREHLNTLNEIWWLSRWRDIDTASIENEKSLGVGPKTVDWSFQALDKKWTVNLEIKNLIRSSATRAYGTDPVFYRVVRGDRVKDDPAPKFRRSKTHELNVLGITWNADLDANLRSELKAYLDITPQIDAIIIWAPHDRVQEGNRFLCLPNKSTSQGKIDRLFQLAVFPDSEDRRPGFQVFRRTEQQILAGGGTVDPP